MSIVIAGTCAASITYTIDPLAAPVQKEQQELQPQSIEELVNWLETANYEQAMLLIQKMPKFKTGSSYTPYIDAAYKIVFKNPSLSAAEKYQALKLLKVKVRSRYFDAFVDSLTTLLLLPPKWLVKEAVKKASPF